MPDWLVPVLGALVLVVVASLPTAALGRPALPLAFAVLTACVGAFAINSGLTRAAFVEDTRSRAVVRFAERAARHGRQRAFNNVLLIDGGSAAARAIDPVVLERALNGRGYRVSVLQLTLAGANHFERFSMNQWFVESVSPATEAWLKGANVVYLAEVHSAYDREPLLQLAGNVESDRAYAYLSPSNAWHAWRAIRLDDGELGDEPLRGGLEWILFRHVAYTAFNVGAASRLIPRSNLQPRSGFSTLPQPAKGYRFKGVTGGLKGLSSPKRGTLRRWLELRERRLRDLYDPLLDRFVYFNLPYGVTSMAAYGRAFCAARREPCIEIDRKLLRRLDQWRLWYDSGHVTRAGAKIYSEWLAAQVANQGLLVL